MACTNGQSLLSVIKYAVLVGILALGSFEVVGSKSPDVLTVCPVGCDFLKIQDATDKAKPGDMIQIDPGVYIEDIVVDRSVTLSGSSADEVVIQGIRSEGWAIGVIEVYALNVTVENLTILGGANGVFVDGAWGSATIRNNVIRDSAQFGIFIVDADAEVVNNVLLHNRDCGVIAFSTKTQQVRGSGNELIGSVLCMDAPAELRKRLTAQTEKSEIEVPGDFVTIQEAIDAVQPGGVVSISPGKYVENLTITKSLTLQALDSRLQIPVTIDGSGRMVISSITDAEDIAILGLTIQNGSRDGILANSNAVIANNIIRRNGGSGIEPTGVGHSFTIRQNQLLDNGAAGIGFSDTDEVAAVVEDNMIFRNGTGIIIGCCTRADFSRNRIFQNNEWGIALSTPNCFGIQPWTRSFKGMITGQGNEAYSNKRGNLCPAFPGDPWPSGFLHLP